MPPKGHELARVGTKLLPWVLVVLGVVAYANSLAGPFIYDDVEAIGENPNIRTLWPIAPALWAPPQTSIAGRPIPSLSMAINYAIGGYDVRGYHAFNVAVHLAAALTLFGVIRRTLEGPALASRFASSAVGLAFAGALLWMVHPLATECVNYVTQRTESLMGLFYLLTLYCSIRATDAPERRRWLIAAVLACGLGMASKESMVTAPLIVLLYDYAFRVGRASAVWRARWPLYLGLASTWTVLAVCNLAGPRSETVGFGTNVPALEYASNQCVMVMTYLRLVVWPHPLSIDYGYPRPLGLAEVALPGVALLALLVTSVIAMTRRPALAFPAVAFFVLLGPTSSIVPISSEVGAERRMYLPLAALVALAVTAGGAVLARRSPRRPAGVSMHWLGAGLVVLLAAASMWGTARRNREYRSGSSIWASAVRAVPDNPRACNNLANILQAEGRLDEALELHRRSVALREHLSLRPEDRARGHFNLGLLLQHTGAYEEAMAEYRLATSTGPHPRAHNNLGGLLQSRGRIDEAIVEFRRASASEGTFALAQYNLGRALLVRGKVDEAITTLRIAVTLDARNAGAHFNLASALMAGGQHEAAIGHYTTAAQLAADHAEMQYAVGCSLRGLGRVTEAGRALRRALELDPGHAGAREELSRLQDGGGP